MSAFTTSFTNDVLLHWGRTLWSFFCFKFTNILPELAWLRLVWFYFQLSKNENKAPLS